MVSFVKAVYGGGAGVDSGLHVRCLRDNDEEATHWSRSLTAIQEDDHHNDDDNHLRSQPSLQPV